MLFLCWYEEMISRFEAQQCCVANHGFLAEPSSQVSLSFWAKQPEASLSFWANQLQISWANSNSCSKQRSCMFDKYFSWFNPYKPERRNNSNERMPIMDDIQRCQHWYSFYTFYLIRQLQDEHDTIKERLTISKLESVLMKW